MEGEGGKEERIRRRGIKGRSFEKRQKKLVKLKVGRVKLRGGTHEGEKEKAIFN